MRGTLIARMLLSAVAVLLLLLVLAGCTAALRPPFDPRATYSSIKKTEPGLLEYKAECLQQLDTPDKRLSVTDIVFVTATFTRYLSKEEVDRLVKDYRLDIHLIISRYLETETGLRGTVAEKSYKGEHRRDFIGYTEVVAYVPKNRLKDFAADDLVFLVDPSGDPHLVSNPDKDYMPGVFWTLEDLNMLARGTATLSVQAIDSQTKKALPASGWLLARLVGNKKVINPQNDLKMERYAQILRFVAPEELGAYDTTITASGYFPAAKTLHVGAGAFKVKVLLEPIPPQTSEEATYDELRSNYAFDARIYRPRYLPEGFRIAPYVNTHLNGIEYHDKNPLYYYEIPAAEVSYSDGKRQLHLRFAQAADIGDVRGTMVDGRWSPSLYG